MGKHSINLVIFVSTDKPLFQHLLHCCHSCPVEGQSLKELRNHTSAPLTHGIGIAFPGTESLTLFVRRIYATAEGTGALIRRTLKLALVCMPPGKTALIRAILPRPMVRCLFEWCTAIETAAGILFQGMATNEGFYRVRWQFHDCRDFLISQALSPVIVYEYGLMCSHGMTPFRYTQKKRSF